jgi:hypothetical protein
MKKGFAILLAVALLMSISGSVFASRLQQVTYRSGFQVANLDATHEAHITVTYYPQGTAAAVDVDDTIDAGGSVTYAALHTEAGDPFNGSVVVSSDMPIAAIANTLGAAFGNDWAYAASTGGFSEGSQSFSLPLLMCNNNDFDTWFNIQNAGTGTANITINYVAGPLGGTDATDTASIEPGRAVTFNQAEGSAGSEKKCAAGLSAAAGGTFVGAATITSNEPIVATVMQLNTGTFRVLMGYNGFTGGAEDIRAPLVMANNAGFFTGIQVQNAGTTSTTVTIDFSANTVGTFNPTDLTFDLDPGAAATYLQAGNDGTNDWVETTPGEKRYIGGATVTSTGGVPLVAIVNQVLAGAVSFGTAYESFSAGDATSSVNVPLVMAQNYGFNTGVQVQNVSTTDACNVTIDFSANTVGTWNPTDLTFSLDAGESATYIQDGNDGTNTWTDRYIGAANITGGCSIVAIVNEINTALGGDQMYTFDAFNY